jgi:hypothetical protein
MPKYRIDALVWSDLDEESFAERAEGAVDKAGIVSDLSVYEVCHMPSYAEQEREARRARPRG